jgi:hypothetical protein
VTWSYLRTHFPRVLITSTLVGLLLTLAAERELDVAVWVALTGVALLAHAVVATTIWALDRQETRRE